MPPRGLVRAFSLHLANENRALNPHIRLSQELAYSAVGERGGGLGTDSSLAV
jgi:hypothetical protein